MSESTYIFIINKVPQDNALLHVLLDWWQGMKGLNHDSCAKSTAK